MIVVRFPVNPVSVPNGTYTLEDNPQDLILQGHRRSLADWLAICCKTLDEHRRLVATGLSVRQALVSGLPFSPVPHRKDTEMLFASVPPFTPDSLPGLDVRVNRLVAHMYLYCDMPEDLRVPWARRLLTQCYVCWRKRVVWHPCAEDWYPHVKVLSLDSKENRDISAWRHLLPVYLDGDWVDGFYPTARLEKFYEHKITHHMHYVTWHDRISGLKLPESEIVSVEAMAKAVSSHKFTMYRSWNRAGVLLGDGQPKTYKTWCELAKKVDAGNALLKAKRKALRKGNIGR